MGADAVGVGDDDVVDDSGGDVGVVQADTALTTVEGDGIVGDKAIAGEFPQPDPAIIVVGDEVVGHGEVIAGLQPQSSAIECRVAEDAVGSDGWCGCVCWKNCLDFFRDSLPSLVKRATTRAVLVACTEGEVPAHLSRAKKPIHRQTQNPVMLPIAANIILRLLDDFSMAILSTDCCSSSTQFIKSRYLI